MMIIAATGHRPEKLGGYGNEVLTRLTEGATRYLEEQRPESVITGMAQGWDTAWAVAAINLGIPFIAALPFPSQSSVWPELARQRWEYLLRKATKVVMVSPGDYFVWKLHKRNYWMVDNSDKLCALWDGNADGGTAKCVAYARRKNKPVDNLWDEYVGARGAA